MTRYPEELQDLVARAYAVFGGSRPRPVHLSLPRDVLPEPVEDDWKTRRAPSLPMPDPAAIDEAADRLAQAKHPLILVDRRRIGDRKSTRLNSSHQIISYAVFCLKKKKKCTR